MNYMFKKMLLIGLITLITCWANASDKNKLVSIFEQASIVAEENPEFLSRLKNLPDELFNSEAKLAKKIIDIHQDYPDSHFAIKTERVTYRVQQARFFTILNIHLTKEQKVFLNSKGRILKSVENNMSMTLQSNWRATPLIEDARDLGINLQLRPKTEVAADSFAFNSYGNWIYIRIPQMIPLQEEHKRLIELLKKRHTYRGVVIDLRGNPGGDDGLMFELGKVLRPKSFSKHQSYEYRRIRSIKSQEGLVRRLKQLVRTYPEYEPILQKHQNELEEMRSDNFSRTIQADRFSGELAASKEFIPPNISIIVDNACASACELFVGLFSNDPNVLTIGEPTKGRFKFGNSGVFELPNLDMKFYIPSFANLLYHTGDEIFGFHPNRITFDRNVQDRLAENWAKKERWSKIFYRSYTIRNKF